MQARVAEQLERAGAFGACLIVGGDERVERFRHPLATGEPMHRLVMAVVVAERHGLHAAATRFACAGGLGDGVRRSRGVAARRSRRTTLAACEPGATYGDVLGALDRAYADAGHPGAWAGHYQGGPVGYRQREFEIVPTQTDSRWFGTPLEAGHAVAWNPSVAGGGKAEDTYLVGEHGLRQAHRHGRLAARAWAPGRARHRERGGGAVKADDALTRLQAGWTSATAFPDGAHFRVEIPSVEGPHVLEEVVVAAEAAGIVVNRVSQGSGAMLLRESELRAMAEIGAGAGIEVSLFVGPREGFDIGAHARSARRRARTSASCAACAGSATRPRTSRARWSAGSAAS